MTTLTKENLTTKAYLLLEDGMFFVGESVGAQGTTYGEICFNTSMTGYQEVFTDPSYFGQILVETNVHVGNYGTMDSENESSTTKIAGLICRNFARKYSRPLASDSLQAYMEKNSLVGIQGIDTRALVRHIRDKGAMNAVISSEIDKLEELKNVLSKSPSMRGLELASKVSRSEPELFSSDAARFKVAAIDYGIKNNIIHSLVERGCEVMVFPAQTTYEQIATWAPDGFFLSNGPGDPASMDYAVDTVSKILNSGKPTFGICLGHQIICLSLGLTTYKMHHGHRGCNHAVKNLITGKCEITSQNHGFGVDLDSAKNRNDVQITHINLNDNTLEGISLNDKPVFSVQYHPEASPGPHDSRYLFDNFIELLQNK